MSTPLVVYLDSQDYSRLDDARAGRGRDKDEDILSQLLEFKSRKIAKFAYSVMNLGEVLQYDGGGRDLTVRKAKTIEILTEGNAFIYSNNLIALQIAEAAISQGIIQRKSSTKPLSDANGWYPSLGPVFQSARNFRENTINSTIGEFSTNRATRRRVKSTVMKYRIGKLPDEFLEKLTQKYPFSKELFSDVFAKFFDLKISKTEAERRLFSEMAEPSRFAIWYFELNKHGKSLPTWLNNSGSELVSKIEFIKDSVKPFLGDQNSLLHFKKVLSSTSIPIAEKSMPALAEECAEHGIDEAMLQTLSSNAEFIKSVPFFEILGRILPDYVVSHSGVMKSPRNPKRSDMGDMFHTLTLPYSDLWRCDAYFSTLVKRHAPNFSHKIVARLEDLPDAIRAASLAR